jgi:hypothetical protein
MESSGCRHCRDIRAKDEASPACGEQVASRWECPACQHVFSSQAAVAALLTADLAAAATVRVASFNTSLNRPDAGGSCERDGGYQATR